MNIFKAKSINPGIYIGKARFLVSKAPIIRHSHISADKAAAEFEYLTDSIDVALAQVRQILTTLPEEGQEKEIFETQEMILADPDILQKLETLVLKELNSAPSAVKIAFDEVIAHFEGMQNDFFASRAVDYKDVQQRLLDILLGVHTDPLSSFQAGEVLFCLEPSPTLISSMATQGIGAWVSQKGAYTSHAAILSRGLNLVAITSIPELAFKVRDGQQVIVDATRGELIVEPDADTLARYQKLKADMEASALKDQARALEPAITSTGRRVRINVNIELPEEAATLKAMGAEGIGLFRTEFLYLDRSSLPDEEEQFQIYSSVAKDMAPFPVTIRTFDLGGDKLSHLIPFEPEENPFLGCRGLRFSLFRPDIFKIQIKAVMRAAVAGNLQLMFPMVNDVEDLLQAKELVAECSKELAEQGIRHKADIPIGVMIEIPSAALCADILASEADFFSIGTNDLTQYTLAVDRNSETLSYKYAQHHPSVLRLIQMVLKAARKAGITVGVCGEMASILQYVPLLVGLGLEDLSVQPAKIATIKSIVRKCDLHLEEMVQNSDLDHLGEVEDLIYKKLKKYYQD
jgi:phosphotransferase system enzyme I (PtsI)